MLLRRGEISVGIVVPPDFERSPRRRPRGGAGAGRRQRYGGAERRSAAGADAAGFQTAGHWPQCRPAVHADQRGELLQPANAARPVNIVPGLIGVILTMTMVLFTGVAIVRERERGNMELLIATPVTPRRTDGRQGAALRGDRPGADHGGAGAGHADCSTCRSAAACSMSTARRCCSSLANLSLGLLISTQAQVAVPGHADDVLRLPAVDPAVGLHVPVRRHAARSRSGWRRSCR